jgi:hypothetical protein
MDLSYLGVPVTANLELIYGSPWQIIEGGNFSVGLSGPEGFAGPGNASFLVSDGTQSDGVPSPLSPPFITPVGFPTGLDAGGIPDVMKTPFYSESTQQTFNAAFFDDIHGDWTDMPGNIYTDPDAGSAVPVPFLEYQIGPDPLLDYGLPNDPSGYLFDNDIEPWVEYDFIVPAPVANKYSYDGLWFTTPENWMVGENNVWRSGGFNHTWYYDWYFGDWYYIGTSDVNTVGYLWWTAVEPNTGQVSLRISASSSNPFAVTQARLEYDYRKDTTAPTFYEQHANVSGNSVSWVVKLQEPGFVTIYVTGPDTFNRSALIDPGMIGTVAGKSGLPSGAYSYTIVTSDLPGNTAIFGPFSFNIP